MARELEQEIVVRTALEKTSTNLGKVTSAATKALSDVVEVVELELSDLTEKVVEKTVELRDLETSLKTRKVEIAEEVKVAKDQADVDAAESKRRASVKLELDIQENKDATVAAILDERGDVSVNASELSDLTEAVVNAKDSNEKEVTSAVKAAEAKAEAKSKQTLEMAALQNKADNAKKDADLTAANSKIDILDSQLTEANKQIGELRSAMTEMITKQSAPVFNMGASK